MVGLMELQGDSEREGASLVNLRSKAADGECDLEEQEDVCSSC